MNNHCHKIHLFKGQRFNGINFDTRYLTYFKFQNYKLRELSCFLCKRNCIYIILLTNHAWRFNAKSSFYLNDKRVFYMKGLRKR